MDYGDIIKRAWNITWRYRILWVFGLFAGTGAGSGGTGGSNYSGSASDFSGGGLPGELQDFEYMAQDWIADNLVFIAAMIAVLVLIGIALFILSVAARGGLIHLVNRAEEGGTVAAGPGWSAGFSFWWPLFIVRLVLYLPLVVLVIALALATLVPVAVGSASGSDTALVGGALGTCGVLAFGGLLVVALGFVVGLLSELAERYIVLEAAPAIGSIGLAWSDLKSNFKHLLLIWLIQLAVSLAFGLVVGVIAVVIGLAAVFAAIGLGPVAAVFVVLVLIAAIALPSAIFSTFVSSIWTVFWRRMTGRDSVAAASAPAPPDYVSGYPSPESQGSYVPPPPPPPGG